mgnify:CR=1 FL=1
MSTNVTGSGQRKHLAALAADTILVVHALFALLAVLGGFLILLDVRFALLHLPIVVWSAAVNLAAWTCPLTPLEQRLRLKAGQSSFEGGWLYHYIDPLLRPMGMPRHLELVAGYSILNWNIAVYGITMLLRY